jgi:hypothetical protein
MGAAIARSSEREAGRRPGPSDPFLVANPGPLGGHPAGAQRPAGPRIATWLILPVVICLSQRLSHACLSISNYTVKLRMAH